MTNQGFCLYIHFPWCIKKCPYCDFNSHELKGELEEQSYIDALIKDLDFDLKHHAPKTKLGAIFMGGGTPSLFSGHAIDRLLRAVKLRLSFSENIEVTMEVNPGAVEHDRFDKYLDAGVNRLSFGAQSFDNSQLQRLGRIHKSDNITVSVNSAREAGFDNYNIDLMYGLPEQTIEQALSDCRQAIALSPSHLSLYQLTIEPNTLFHKRPPVLPDQDLAVQMQQELVNFLANNGYQRYEVSAYSLSGKQSNHNLNYWHFGDYLGIGAGAHSKRTIAGKITRCWKQKHPKTYLTSIQNNASVANYKAVDQNDVLFEFLMNALRLTDGFVLNLASKVTGIPEQQILNSISEAINDGLLEHDLDKGIVKCTPSGYLFLDDILVRLLP